MFYGTLGVVSERANEGPEGAPEENAAKKSDANSQTSSGFLSNKNCKKSAKRARSSGCRRM